MTCRNHDTGCVALCPEHEVSSLYPYQGRVSSVLFEFKTVMVLIGYNERRVFQTELLALFDRQSCCDTTRNTANSNATARRGGVHVSASLPTASYIGRLDVLTELLSSSRKLQY